MAEDLQIKTEALSAPKIVQKTVGEFAEHLAELYAIVISEGVIEAYAGGADKGKFGQAFEEEV